MAANNYATPADIEQYKAEAFRRLLTKRHCSSQPHYLSKVLNPWATAARQRYQETNLVGIGFGVKETGKACSGTLAVRIYVVKKVSERELPRKHRIPTAINGTPTDVVPVGRLRHHDRPVPLGTSISRINGGTGSMGCIVDKPGDAKRYLLSAAHVLAPDPQARIGDIILQPALPNSDSQPIATLEDFEPLHSNGTPNQMDAALGKLFDKADVALTIPQIGKLRAEAMDAVLYESVRKFGAGTFHTLGIVTDASVDIPIGMPGQDSILYEKVVTVTGAGGNFSAGGDSGAAVVDAMSSRPIGLIIGGQTIHTFVSPLARILKRFVVSIAQD